MKKNKLLSATTLLTVLPATFCLSQCTVRKDKTEGFFLDESVKDLVKFEDDEDKSGNKIFYVELLGDSYKKNKIKEVKITCNGSELSNSEYKVEDDPEWAGKVIITIYKSTLDAKKGKYVIKPIIVAKEFNGIIAELERKSYFINDKVTTKNIKIYQSLEGYHGDEIKWSNEMTVYEGTQQIPDFIQNGITLTSSEQRTLTIKYKNYSSDVTIKVSKKELKVNCSIDSDECVTLSADSFVANEGDKWGTVMSKPVPKAKKDVNTNALSWTWVDPVTGSEISDDTLITNEMKAKLVTLLPETTDKESIEFNTSCTLLEKASYVPAACAEEKTIELKRDIEYTFTIDTTGKNIKYFQIANYSTYKEAPILYLYARSVVSAKLGEDDLNYTIVEKQGGGTYLDFGPAISSGTLTLTFRMLDNFDCIPAFVVA